MTRRNAVGNVVDRMHGQSSTYSSRGIFPVNVNSLRARGAARVAIKNVFAPTARHDNRSPSTVAGTVHGTSEAMPELPLGDLHQLTADVAGTCGRLTGIAHCSSGVSMKRKSTRVSTKVRPCSAEVRPCTPMQSLDHSLLYFDGMLDG